MSTATTLANRYRLGRAVEISLSGQAYEARDIQSDTRCTVIVPRDQPDLTCYASFVAAARKLMAVDHPNVARVYCVQDRGAEPPFVVLEPIDGESLAARLKRERRLSFKRGRALLRQIAEGLGAAHHAGVVHGRLSPMGIHLVRRLSGNDEVKLIDFGPLTLDDIDTERDHLPERGMAFYMSPEQTRGEVSMASDVYAIGVLAHQFFVGERPFTGMPLQVALMHAYQQVPAHPELRQSPAGVEALVMRAMAREPKDRPGTVREFEVALRRINASIPGVAATPVEPDSDAFDEAPTSALRLDRLHAPDPDKTSVLDVESMLRQREAPKQPEPDKTSVLDVESMLRQREAPEQPEPLYDSPWVTDPGQESTTPNETDRTTAFRPPPPMPSPATNLTPAPVYPHESQSPYQPTPGPLPIPDQHDAPDPIDDQPSMLEGTGVTEHPKTKVIHYNRAKNQLGQQAGPSPERAGTQVLKGFGGPRLKAKRSSDAPQIQTKPIEVPGASRRAGPDEVELDEVQTSPLSRRELAAKRRASAQQRNQSQHDHTDDDDDDEKQREAAQRDLKRRKKSKRSLKSRAGKVAKGTFASLFDRLLSAFSSRWFTSFFRGSLGHAWRDPKTRRLIIIVAVTLVTMLLLTIILLFLFHGNQPEKSDSKAKSKAEQSVNKAIRGESQRLKSQGKQGIKKGLREGLKPGS